MKAAFVAVALLVGVVSTSARLNEDVTLPLIQIQESRRALLQGRSFGTLQGWKKTVKVAKKTVQDAVDEIKEYLDLTIEKGKDQPTSFPTKVPSGEPTQAPSHVPTTSGSLISFCDLGTGMTDENGVISRTGPSQWTTAFSCEKYSQGSISFEIVQPGGVVNAPMLGLSSWTKSGDNVYARVGNLLVQRGLFYSNNIFSDTTCPIAEAGDTVKMVFDTQEGYVAFSLNGLLCSSWSLSTTSTDGFYVAVTLAVASKVRVQSDFVPLLPSLPPKPVTFCNVGSNSFLSNYDKQLTGTTLLRWESGMSCERYTQATASFMIESVSNYAYSPMIGIATKNTAIEKTHTQDGALLANGQFFRKGVRTDFLENKIVPGDILTFALDSVEGTLAISLNGVEAGTMEISPLGDGYYWTVATVSSSEVVSVL